MGRLIRMAKNFGSRQIRTNATGGKILRTWEAAGWLKDITPKDPSAPIKPGEEQPKPGGVLGFLQNLGGFITGAAKAIFKVVSFTVVGLFNIAKGIFDAIWNFNWNISDKQILNTIGNQWANFGVRFAGLAGRATGWLVGGLIPGSAIAVFNEPLAVYVLKEVGEEALEDMLTEFSSVLSTFGRALLTTAILGAYGGIRGLIRWSGKRFTEAQKGILISKGIVPVDEKSGKNYWDTWGSGEEWSFRKKFNEWKDKLGGGVEWLQNMVDEFIDEFQDAVWEALYAVCQGIDSWVSEQAMTLANIGGEPRSIEVELNESETLKLSGGTEDVKGLIQNTTATYKLLENRDIGTGTNVLYEDIPITESNGVEVTLILYNYEKPPYWTKERRKNIVKSEISIPNCKRSIIGYDRLKNLFGGGSSAYTKGNWSAEASLSNGRTLKVFVNSESEGEKVLEALASICEANIIYPIRLTHRKGSRTLQKTGKERDDTRMFLSFAIIRNWNKLTKYEEFKRLGGVASVPDPKKLIKKIPLYYDTKPSFIDRDIQEALSNSLNVD